eukprot:CAMPEP_0181092650 /NCGR_PEP_ID=MMETSP1071-20121207/9029_1 /TAXON_ID=35127 /ORGANISM="Thalassiosira sp., Strain NH16" /LENGTH=473 /DNA_ID=CAMNT_0023174839 /DNA_START=420 /DNA_END=1841 /DNA_ORIENTATION=-
MMVPPAANNHSAPSPNNAHPSSARSLHSQVHDAVSVTRDRFADVVSHIQRPETRALGGGLKDGWDAMVKVMFAPCAGDVGGVPRDEALLDGNDGVCTPPRASPCGKVRGGSAATPAATPPWGASVPFEVSTSQQDRSLLMGSSFVSTRGENPAADVPSRRYPVQQQRGPTPREQRNARSRAKLRQLGAQHQLAGGFPGGGLADAARPVSPAEEEGSPDLADFDDGISAISSHTLEEMERRRQAKERKNVVRLHPLDFTQIIDEEAELECDDGRLSGVVEEVDEKNTEVVFGEPFYEEEEYGNGPATGLESADCLDRTGSARAHQTLDTTATEESNEFEEMHRRHEAVYWADQDQLASSERAVKDQRAGRRTSQRMGIEERARRLRELSRSRSRSDGTSSSNKSGASSLVSRQHPHDTFPLFSSDLFARRKKSSSSRATRSTSGSQHGSEFVSGSRTPASTGSDPFASLDYGEI